jgi:hypothetical protein
VEVNVIVDESCRVSGVVGISGVCLELDPYVMYLHRSQAREITNPHIQSYFSPNGLSARMCPEKFLLQHEPFSQHAR